MSITNVLYFFAGMIAILLYQGLVRGYIFGVCCLIKAAWRRFLSLIDPTFPVERNGKVVRLDETENFYHR